jgi:maltose alpha-D-glucosyltransferase/alpha-amylase
MLGERTADLHKALASSQENPGFAPEPFTLFYQRSLLQSFRNLTEHVFEALARQLPHIAEDTQALARRVLELKPEILEIFRFITSGSISALRTRVHGDYHLGQVLWTGRDFVIIDFEGEPSRTITARRIKRSPLRDVAGMIRSFDYAVNHGLKKALKSKGEPGAELAPKLEPFAEHWYQWSASAFLRAYLRTAQGAAFLPSSRDELAGLLDVYILEKAVYELGYELDHRPDWVYLPLRGIERLIRRRSQASRQSRPPELL